MKITSRKEALNSGLKYYFTGKPCKRGHTSKRKSHSGTCYECFLESQRESYDSEKSCARVRDYYKRNRRERLKYYSDYARKNKDKRSNYQSSWYKENRELEIKKALLRKKENPALNAKRSNEYRARKIKAVPRWFESELVAKVYEKARFNSMHVDHIVPLKSNLVCGLHCWHNLQLIDSSHNASKGNRYWPDMPESLL